MCGTERVSRLLMARRRFAGFFVLFACIALSGCQRDSSPPKTAGSQPIERTETRSDNDQATQANADEATSVSENVDKNQIDRPEKQASAVTPIALAKLEPAEMPKVVLSEAHAALCLAKVGDAMPDAALTGLNGKSQQLSALLGKQLTVVTFWTADDRYGLQELEDLSRLVAAPYSGYGVNVIGINTQNPAAEVQKITSGLEVIFPVLLDDGGKLLGQMATDKLPRTYLLDATGKILWLDLEYSRTTRRDLLSAIRSQLAGK